MPTNTRASIVAGIVLGTLILLVWGVLLATLSDLDAGDAMGKALAEGFAALEIILLWILLGVLLLVAALKGAMPRAAAVASLVLLIASGIASTGAVELLADRSMPPFYWPLLTPMLVPPIVVAFCFWALLPSLRATVPAGAAAGTALGAMLVLTTLMVPMHQIRERVHQREAVQRQDWARDFAALPADAPLWDVTPFLEGRDETRVQAVLDRIRHLDRRQTDAENMLDRGDFPLAYLGAFDLDPTPAVCARARSLLLRRVQPLIPRKPGAAPYVVIANEVAGAVAAMAWLVGYGCSSDAEAEAWEAMADAYRNPNFDVVRLRELRDPKELGRALREHPARFSMLTPQAHLTAWLTFADDNNLRDQALAGARKLDHRTSDAVDMLRANEYDAYRLLMYLPALDLETTPALCDAVLKALHERFVRIYLPPADDPRPYQELLERLGIGDPLIALQWVAAHGCDANDALTEAETLVRSYQDSLERSAMLARLAELHRS